MSKKKEPSGSKNGNNKLPVADNTHDLETSESTEALKREKELQKGEAEEEPHIHEVGVTEEPALSSEEAAKIIKEKEEYYDRLLRTQADFDNYRKRVQKEQVYQLKYGAENALREILPVVDNIERALASARKHAEPNSHIEGLGLILSQFLEILGRLGVKPIETVGQPFDPNKHDALLRVHKPDLPEGTVVEEVRKGYYLHDKILRPAQVTVSAHDQV